MDGCFNSTTLNGCLGILGEQIVLPLFTLFNKYRRKGMGEREEKNEIISASISNINFSLITVHGRHNSNSPKTFSD